MSDVPSIGFIGGTGPQGRGLAMRLALAGYACVIGSRTEEKGRDAAAKAMDALAEAGRAVDLSQAIAGGDNATAARSDVVMVVVPYEAQETVLPPLAPALEGKTVVNCINALSVDDRGPYPVRVPGGSAAEECQELLPGARVVGGFQNVSAVALRRVGQPVDADVVLTGDDEAAREQVAAIARSIAGVRAVHAGSLRLSAPVEDLTALLLAVNKRYKSHASLRLGGLTDEMLAALDGAEA